MGKSEGKFRMENMRRKTSKGKGEKKNARRKMSEGNIRWYMSEGKYLTRRKEQGDEEKKKQRF